MHAVFHQQTSCIRVFPAFRIESKSHSITSSPDVFLHWDPHFHNHATIQPEISHQSAKDRLDSRSSID